MNEHFKLRRIRFFRQWSPPNPSTHHAPHLLFPIEDTFLKLIVSSGVQVYTPYQFKNNDDRDFHHSISFLIDSIEQIPYRLDLSFDFSWKALESYLGRFAQANITDQLDKVTQTVWTPTIDGHASQTFDKLLRNMPIQALKFFVKELSEGITSGQSSLLTRLYKPLGNGNIQYQNIKDIVDALNTKFNLVALTPQQRRDCARVLGMLLNGQEVELNGAKFQLSLNERMHFLIKGILYTFRNNRTHGDFFSPFKSSKATIQTFTLPHYCLIATNFLFLCLLVHENNRSVSVEDVNINISENLESFQRLYGKHLYE